MMVRCFWPPPPPPNKIVLTRCQFEQIDPVAGSREHARAIESQAIGRAHRQVCSLFNDTYTTLSFTGPEEATGSCALDNEGHHRTSGNPMPSSPGNTNNIR